MIQSCIDAVAKRSGWFARRFARRLSNAFVQERYHFYGAVFGDAVSYLAMGECTDFRERFEAWAYWERHYSERGFRTISIDALVKIGGWGHDAAPHLGQIRGPEEAAVLHSERYRDRFLGKMPPGVLQGGFGPLLDDDGKPRTIQAVYPTPSTKDPSDDP